jgi:hypothetical protein
LDVARFGSQVEGFAYSAGFDFEFDLSGAAWSIAGNILTLKGIAYNVVDYVGEAMVSENFHVVNATPHSTHPIAPFFDEMIDRDIKHKSNYCFIDWLCFGMTVDAASATTERSTLPKITNSIWQTLQHT